MGAVSQYRFSRIYSSGHAEHGTDRDYLLNPVTPNKKKTTIVITQTISYITRASGEPQVLLLGGDADRIRFRHGRDHWFYDFFSFFFFSYLVHVPTGVFNVLGLRIILSKMATIWSNLGRSARSFCQQSSMSWWSPGGQSMGAGRRYPSSIALMTFK